MSYGMFDKVDSIRSHLPGLILNVIRSHYTKCHEKEASAKEKQGWERDFDRTATHNAGSINEGLFVKPINRVGTPKQSTPSIFANSLMEIKE